MWTTADAVYEDCSARCAQKHQVLLNLLKFALFCHQKPKASFYQVLCSTVHSVVEVQVGLNSQL